MATTPDAVAIRRLNEALEAHRGDSDAYRRLGTRLRDQRPLLDRRYGNRSLFARERLVDDLGLNVSAAYKLAAEVESGFGQDRQGTSVATMLTVAEAYAVTLEWIAAALDGEVEPARPAEAAPADGAWLRIAMTDEQLADRRPFADAIHAAMRRWTARYAREHPDVDPADIPEPSGAELFLDEPQDAKTWDTRTDLPADERVWLIAALQAWQASARRRDTGVG